MVANPSPGEQMCTRLNGNRRDVPWKALGRREVGNCAHGRVPSRCALVMQRWDWSGGRKKSLGVARTVERQLLSRPWARGLLPSRGPPSRHTRSEGKRMLCSTALSRGSRVERNVYYLLCFHVNTCELRKTILSSLFRPPCRAVKRLT